MTVAEVLAEELWSAGVRRIYGMPGGGSNMTLIDAATARGLAFVLAHHETGAAFMAAAEAELTGAPGVCLSTVGPGAANSANGLLHCSLDRVPLLLITDQLDDPLTLHQRVDHHALLAAVTKWSADVTPEGARDEVRRALAHATAQPAGPVHLDLAGSVAAASFAGGQAPDVSPGATAGDSPQIWLEEAVELLAAAQRPVALVGLRARSDESAASLRTFAEAFELPVLCTYKARGVIPDGHPLAWGLVTNGHQEAAVLDRADALLLVGFDPTELMFGPWRWQLPTVAVGNPPPPRGPLPAAVELELEPAEALGQLGTRLRERSWRAHWDTPAPSRIAPPLGEEAVSPAEVVAACDALAPEGTVATVDAGSHMFAATLFWRARGPRRFLISNGLATMGYALPAAIGAALCQKAPVVCFTGDGGLAMCAGELATAARLGVPVIVVVFNDGALNLIKTKQEKRGSTTHGLDFEAVDWATVARGFGLESTAASTRDEVAVAFEAALAARTPWLIDARVDAATYADLLTLVRG